MKLIRMGVLVTAAGASMLAGAQITQSNGLEAEAMSMDDAAAISVPSSIRPIVDARTHRMRLGVKIARSYETRQVTDLEKAWGTAGPDMPGGTAVSPDLGNIPGVNLQLPGSRFMGAQLSFAGGTLTGAAGESAGSGSPGQIGSGTAYFQPGAASNGGRTLMGGAPGGGAFNPLPQSSVSSGLQ
jgi:hypothetical protein